MPGRSYVGSTGYRYGFNGQEKDDEIAGNGNSNTAKFWQYDPRLGRRWNVDPVKIPSEGPYVAFSDNPIIYNDPNGDFRTKFGARVFAFFTGGTINQDEKTGEWGVAKVTKNANGAYEFNQRYDWTTKRSYALTEKQEEDFDAALDVYEHADDPTRGGTWDPTLNAEQAKKNFINLNLAVALPNIFKRGTIISNTEKATPITKNSVIEGYSVSNHAWRKSGLGRGATEELVSATINGAQKTGNVVTEVGSGKFAGNIIKVYNHEGVKVAVDETRKLIMSIRPETGFKLK